MNNISKLMRRRSSETRGGKKKRHLFAPATASRLLCAKAFSTSSSSKFPEHDSNKFQLYNVKESANAKRILVTGASGQIGVELVPMLRKRYGQGNVIATDISKDVKNNVAYCDVLDFATLQRLVQQEGINLIIHNAAMLSAVGERFPEKALFLNTRGIENILQVAKDSNCQVFAPSTIAVFGSSTPKDNTPNDVVMQPNTIYGISKVYLELLGSYYFQRFGVDFRSIRYPGILSSKSLPGGGTTDYAVDIFYQAHEQNKYSCFLKPDSMLPMMHMDECVKATIQLIEADPQRLSRRVYNVASHSFDPQMLAKSIQNFMPQFQISYKPDFRQKIADTWPRSIDDTLARNDFDWSPEYGLKEMTKLMLEDIGKRLESSAEDEEPKAASM